MHVANCPAVVPPFAHMDGQKSWERVGSRFANLNLVFALPLARAVAALTPLSIFPSSCLLLFSFLPSSSLDFLSVPRPLLFLFYFAAYCVAFRVANTEIDRGPS